MKINIHTKGSLIILTNTSLQNSLNASIHSNTQTIHSFIHTQIYIQIGLNLPRGLCTQIERGLFGSTTMEKLCTFRFILLLDEIVRS